MSVFWNGIPENPEKSGWHLVCRKEVPSCGIEAYDEVWFWNGTSTEIISQTPEYKFFDISFSNGSFWSRRENGSKIGYEPIDFAWNWDYIAPLKYDIKK